MKLRIFLASLAALWAVSLESGSFLGAQELEPLALTFEDRSVVVDGASPGGDVVWFSIASESSLYVSTTVPRSRVGAADASGRASFELEEAMPPRSIWAAVDLASGAFGIATPQGYPLRKSDLAAGAIKQDPTGRASLLAATWTDLHLLVVRPGQGSWLGRFSEGAPDDADGALDGVVTAALPSLRSLGASARVPDEFAIGDVIIAIDPIEMVVVSFRLQH
jgi:hypothetical protein